MSLFFLIKKNLIKYYNHNWRHCIDKNICRQIFNINDTFSHTYTYK